MNPLMMIGKMMRNGGNPQQIFQQMMGSNQIVNNPMAKNAMEMLQKGDSSGLQSMAENLARERGTTIDDVKSIIIQQFGIK